MFINKQQYRAARCSLLAVRCSLLAGAAAAMIVVEKEL
jgi:hypothetical protein